MLRREPNKFIPLDSLHNAEMFRFGLLNDRFLFSPLEIGLFLNDLVPGPARASTT